MIKNGSIAQLEEQVPLKDEVLSSNLSGPTISDLRIADNASDCRFEDTSSIPVGRSKIMLNNIIV